MYMSQQYILTLQMVYIYVYADTKWAKTNWSPRQSISSIVGYRNQQDHSH